MNNNDKDFDFDDIIIQEFKKVLLRQYFITGSILFIYPILILLTAIFSNRFGEIPRILALGIGAVVIAPLGLAYFNWRCPRCGAFLNKNSLFISHCHMCGVRLR